MAKVLKKKIPLLLFFIIFTFLILKNFPFGTWYTGWDNLHPEFNFALNIKRVIFSVWQENQGLGTYGGHGYAATLPHTLFLFLLSFFLPQKYLRPTFTFLTLILGALGVFYLIRKILKNEKGNLRDMTALLGAMFYLLNFGTVQNFYVQLEAFIVHFACLPWLFYSLLNFLEKKTKKSLILFSLITFFSSTQGFIPPLFLAYFLFLSLVLFFYVLEKTGFKRIKESILIIFLTIAINAYWLLPVAYYALTRSHIYLNAYNNLASTEDFILQNKKYGNLKDVILLRGFLSETIDTSEQGKVFSIFNPWINHFNNKWVVYLGYLYFCSILIGALNFLFKKTRWLHLAFLLALIISFSCLATNVFPFSLISVAFQNIPIFKQAFRAAFTKFSISLSLFYALFLGIGMSVLMSNLEKISKIKISKYLFFLLCSSFIYFSLPAFAGNLFYKRSRVDIPKAYFDLFEFFKKQDKKGRIANFPQGWHWGWSIYRWGYSGSGFLWYGIGQPILDRAFDVWGKENENYHWEVIYALYSQNFSLFEKILDKYQINWLILDKNIIPYQNTRGFLFVDEFENFLDNSNKVTLEKTFKSPEAHVREIKVYKVNLSTKPKDFVTLLDLNQVKNIGSQYDFSGFDQAFLEEGNYYTDLENEFDIYYPFRSLFTGRKQEELEFQIEDYHEFITFKKALPSSLENYTLKIPAIKKEEFLEINPEDPGKTEYKFPEIFLDGNPVFSPKNEDELKELEIRIPKPSTGELEIRIPKIRGYFAYNSDADPNFLNHEAQGCNSSQKGIFKQERVDKDVLQFTSLDSENCFDIILPHLSQRLGYLIQIQSRAIKGKALQFAVINHDSKKADLEVSLPKLKELNTAFFILPSMKPFGQGYSLHFNNVSVGKVVTVNDLKKVTLNPIPFNFLKGLKLVKPSAPLASKKQLLVYSQSFDPGWIAFYFDGLKPTVLKDRVLVNNWANGWEIKLTTRFSTPHSGEKTSGEAASNLKLYIFYWPWVLEYFGLAMMIGFLIFMVKCKYDQETNHSESTP